MGLFRLLLAALVVLFHFGGLPWIVGRIAVYAFYGISGFLIFQVLDRVYVRESMGVGRFWANRFVRLMPPYLAYAVATALLLGAGNAWAAALQASGVQVADGTPTELLRRTLTFAPLIDRVGALPILTFTPPLIPQGWSIGVEATFYLLAPIVVLTTRQRPLLILVWLALAAVPTGMALHAATLNFNTFELGLYNNVYASAVVFLTGGALYYVRRTYGAVVPSVVAMVAVITWVTTIAVPGAAGGALSAETAPAFGWHLLVMMVVTALVLLSRASARITPIDRAAGNLCYGVYLNHFIVATLLEPTVIPAYGGEPRRLMAGLVILLGSIMMAAATYALIEHPLDALRTRVRGVEPPGASVERRFRGLPVHATVLVILSLIAVGWTMVGPRPEPELPLSRPFHIRWKPDVTGAARRRIEESFGLVVEGPVTRDPRHRTYEYRLPQPTPGRVRALVTRSEVEDTASVDLVDYAIED